MHEIRRVLAQICWKKFLHKLCENSLHFEILFLDSFFLKSEELEINGTFASLVTNTTDGLSVGNKSAENVKSRHVVIRYGLLVLRRANLLGVQNNLKHKTTTYSLEHPFVVSLSR